MTMGEFQRGQNNKNWPIPTMDTTPSLDGTDEAVLSVEITAIGQYIRSLDGIIQIMSEPGSGTIFSLELAFEHAPVMKLRKPRSMFLSTPRKSIGPPPKGPSPPPIKSPIRVSEESRMRGGDGATDPSRAYFRGESPQSSGLSPPSYTQLHTSSTSQHDREDSVSNPMRALPHIVQDNVDGLKRHSHSRLNILVADGDFFVLQTLDEKLSQWGHSVTTASDGQVCHDRFASNTDKFDIILMDLKVCHP
jgi:hypothetical protein